jgi:hypothetical protein
MMVLLLAWPTLTSAAVISNVKDQCPFQTPPESRIVSQTLYHPSVGAGGFFDFTATCLGSASSSQGSASSSIPTFDFASVLQINTRQASTVEDCGTVNILECCLVVPEPTKDDDNDNDSSCTLGSSFALCSNLGVSPNTPLTLSCDQGGGILHLQAMVQTLLLPDTAGYSYFLSGDTRAIPQVDDPTVIRLSSESGMIQVYVASSQELLMVATNCPGFCYDNDGSHLSDAYKGYMKEEEDGGFPMTLTDCFDAFSNIPDVCKPPTMAPTFPPTSTPSLLPTRTSQPTFVPFDTCPNNHDLVDADGTITTTGSSTTIIQGMFQRVAKADSTFTFFAMCVGGTNGVPNIFGADVVTYVRSTPFECGDIAPGNCCLVDPISGINATFLKPNEPSCDGSALALCSRVTMTSTNPLVMSCSNGGILKLVANTEELVLSNTQEYSYFLSDTSQAQAWEPNDGDVTSTSPLMITSKTSTIGVIVAESRTFLQTARACDTCYEDYILFPEAMRECLSSVKPPTRIPRRCRSTGSPSVQPSGGPSEVPSGAPIVPEPSAAPQVTGPPSNVPSMYPSSSFSPTEPTCPTTFIGSSIAPMTEQATSSLSIVSQRMYHPEGGAMAGMFDFFALCYGSTTAIPEVELVSLKGTAALPTIEFKRETDIVDCGNGDSVQCCVVIPEEQPLVQCEGRSYSFCSRFGLGPKRALDLKCSDGGMLQLLAQTNRLVLPINSGYFYFFSRDTLATEREIVLSNDEVQTELVLTSASATVSVFVATEQVFLDVTNACEYCYDNMENQFPTSMGACFQSLSTTGEDPTFCPSRVKLTLPPKTNNDTTAGPAVAPVTTLPTTTAIPESPPTTTGASTAIANSTVAASDAGHRSLVGSAIMMSLALLIVQVVF